MFRTKVSLNIYAEVQGIYNPPKAIAQLINTSNPEIKLSRLLQMNALAITGQAGIMNLQAMIPYH